MLHQSGIPTAAGSRSRTKIYIRSDVSNDDDDGDRKYLSSKRNLVRIHEEETMATMRSPLAPGRCLAPPHIMPLSSTHDAYPVVPSDSLLGTPSARPQERSLEIHPEKGEVVTFVVTQASPLPSPNASDRLSATASLSLRKPCSESRRHSHSTRKRECLSTIRTIM